MARSTVEAFENVRRVDHGGKLDESPMDKQKGCHSLASRQLS